MKGTVAVTNVVI
jgi:hypothetical protein